MMPGPCLLPRGPAGPILLHGTGGGPIALATQSEAWQDEKTMSLELEERTTALERRTDRLEMLFERFMEQTTTILKEMKEEAAKDRKEAERARAKDRRDVAMRQEKVDRERAEDRREWNRRWGELANRMGTVVEDIIAPSIRRLARDQLDCGDELLFCPRISRVRSDDRHYSREFDALYVGTDAMLLNESKTTVRSEDARAFADFLKRNEFALYFPEYRHLPIVPVFSSLSLTENLVTYLTRNGIYAVAMGDEAMQVLNQGQVTDQRGRRDRTD